MITKQGVSPDRVPGDPLPAMLALGLAKIYDRI
jgi:hypothetical protein